MSAIAGALGSVIGYLGAEVAEAVVFDDSLGTAFLRDRHKNIPKESRNGFWLEVVLSFKFERGQVDRETCFGGLCSPGLVHRDLLQRARCNRRYPLR
jgi:hypothetical protein